MPDISLLAERTLDKIGVLGQSSTMTDEERTKAMTALKTAHYELEAEKVLRWSMSDIPVQAEEGYVMVAAFYAAPDFGWPADINLKLLGMKLIRAYAMTPKADAPAPAEYF